MSSLDRLSGIAATLTAEPRWPLSALWLPPSEWQLAIVAALGSAQKREVESRGEVLVAAA
jgi:hypothetical protein